ncbi:hypothetical protein AB6A40_006093 [Gnathostoma spinigerum]|uniref:Ig-like domain-containing protein n=1 Tax=Gnathostoma spinigerum TaxID=75299 RepID=A0ABD6EQ08_9BILA
MSGLDKLEFLDLSDNALSVCVEDGSVLANTTFPFLRTLKLSSNRIRIIPSRAFERFPSLKILDLSDNPIASVQEGAFDPLSLDTLIINTSSVLCDCELKWLSSWLRSSGLDSRTVSIICLYPTSVRSMALNSLDTSQLTCVDESPRARLLDHPVSLIKALTRSSVHLKCRGYGAAPLDIMWKVIQKGRTRTLALDATTDLTVNRTSVNGSSSEYSQEYLSSELVLTQVDLNDQAEYQCVVRNNYGTDYSLRSKLVVLEKPQIRQGPSNISVLKGHSIWLKCSVQGIPSPIVKWQKDGGDTFPAATERRLHVKLDDDNLYVVNVSIADSGLYTCRAINEAGRDESSAFVHVYDYQFRSKLKDQTTQLGDSVVFDCSAGMHPPVTINWYHNGIRISHFSPRFSLKGNSQLLIINKVRSSDSGLYRCQIDVDGKTLTAQSAHLFIDNAYLNEDSYKRGPDELLVLHEYLLTVISRICLLLASILVLAVILSTILLWRSRRHPTNTAAPTSATVLDEVRRTSTTEMPSSVQISGEKLFEICSAI